MRTVSGSGQVLESVIQTSLRIVYEIAVCHRIGRGHIYFVSGNRVTVLLQRIRQVIRGKLIMLFVRIAVAVFQIITKFIDICQKTFGINISIISRIVRVAGTPEVAAG